MCLRTPLAFLTLFSLLLFAAEDPTHHKINIAVSDLAGQGIDTPTASVISDRLRSELFNTGIVTVIERSQMQEILKEQGFQQSGCTSDKCAIETGQLLGVKYIIVGSIGHIGHTYTIASRLIDVSTGQMAATANVDCKCEIDDILSRSTVELAHKLMQSFTAKKGAESSKPTVYASGSLKIVSNPVGAFVFVNHISKGITPIVFDSLKAGRYLLNVELKGYNPVADDVRVIPGSMISKKYVLKSLSITPSAPGGGKKHTPIWLKITLGAGAIAAIGTGFIFDGLVKDEKNACTILADQYSQTGSNAAYATYRQDYLDHYGKAKKNTTYRNVLYGAGGVLLAGFAISFAF
jgi:TolB-like protein